jgi:hypothetical protein
VSILRVFTLKSTKTVQKSDNIFELEVDIVILETNILEPEGNNSRMGKENIFLFIMECRG